jgi:branched-chain amino acid transport system permease protein
MSMVIRNIFVLIYGNDYYYTPSIIKGEFLIGNISISYQRLLVSVIAIFIMLFLNLFLTRTKSGMSIIAVSQNTRRAQAVGINLKNIYALTFGISITLASVSGALISPIFWVYRTLGVSYQLMAMVIIIFGGMTSIPGSVIASFIIGVLEGVSVMFIGSEYKFLLGFLIMIFMLLLRPQGIMGEKVME